MKNDTLQDQSPLTQAYMHALAFRYAGKSLLKSEIFLDDTTLNLLVAQNYFKKIPSIRHLFFYSICTRCGNRKHALMGKIPCQRCQKTHLYCRYCIQMGRVMECEPLYEWSGPQPEWPIHMNACRWKGTLTPQQQHAANEIVQAIKQSQREILTWAVCGAGKTEMLFPGIDEALRDGKRICLATPRSDVVRELLPRIKAAFEGVHIQGLYAGSQDKDGTGEFIISTTHQLLRYKNAFDVMIIDEVDAFPYHADPALMYASKHALKDPHTLIYLTATPRQSYKKRIHAETLPCVFVPTRFHGHPLPVPRFRMCFSLKKDLQKYQPPESFFKWMTKRENPQRQLLIFVSTIKLAEKLTEQLQYMHDAQDGALASMPMPISYVHADDEQRKEKVRQFRNKEITTLITTTILERGVTFPSVDVAILDAGHVVFDEAALVQMAGRAGRSADDPTGEVVFFHDGKTKAMVDAVRSIQEMNKRGGFV